MSEYAGATEPVIRLRSLRDLDHTDTLFEGQLMLLEAPDATKPDVNGDESFEQEARPTQWYPKSVKEHHDALTRRMLAKAARSDDDRLSPHEELGGLQPEHQDDAFDEVLRRYEPWMRDVMVAVEWYGLFDMTVADVDRMTTSDRNVLALYVDGYMEGLDTVQRLIAAYKDYPTDHEFMNKYDIGGRRTKAELRTYYATIDILRKALKEGGVAGRLQQVAIQAQPYTNKRQERRKKDRLDKKGSPRVIFTPEKPRIER